MTKGWHKNHPYFLFISDNSNININISRIRCRVEEGGHDIPPEIVMHRYRMAITYLKGKLHLFKEIHFIDNSSDEAIEVAYIKDGKLIENKNVSYKWLNEVLFIGRKLQKPK